MVPNGDLEPFFYTSQDIADMKPGAIRTDFRANNSVVIPASSKNSPHHEIPGLVVQSKDNHDLFELGIEGEHWIKDGDNGYKTTDKTSNYLFQGYELPGIRISPELIPTMIRKRLNSFSIQWIKNSYYQVPLAGIHL